MNRNATLQNKPDKMCYEVVLIEDNQVVHRKEYMDYKMAEAAKLAWLNGEGPAFLAG